VEVAKLLSPSKRLGVVEALVNKVEEAEEEASRPMCRVASGVIVPMPTLPVGATASMEVPDEEATLKIVLAEPEVPWMLKLTVDEVAL